MSTITLDIKYTINDILVDNNLELLLRKFTCCVCLDIIYKKEVLQCREGHWACKECWISSSGHKRKCMQCKVKIKSVLDLSRNRYIEDEFNDKLVYCPNRFIYQSNENSELKLDKENGCIKTVTINELDSHLTKCQFKHKKCKFADNGCKFIDRFNKLQVHIDKCEYELVTCEHCKRNDIKKSNLSEHHLKCTKMKISCTQCNDEELIERDQLQLHIDNDCTHTIISCKYKDVGCDDTFKRCDLLNHLSNVNHTMCMGNLIDRLSLESKDEIRKYNQLLCQYTIELKKLSNENRENIKSLGQHTVELKSLSNEYKECNQSLDQKSLELKKLSNEGKGYNQSLSQHTVELKKLSNENKECNQSFVQLSLELKKLSNESNGYKQLLDQQTVELKKLSDKNKECNQLFDQQSLELKKLSNECKEYKQLLDQQTLDLKKLSDENKEIRNQSISTEYKNKWVIKKYKDITTFIFSPPFNVGYNSMKFFVYPNRGQYFQIYLSLDSSSSQLNVSVSVSVTLVNKDKTKNKTSEFDYTFTNSAKAYGLHEFLKTELITIENGWLSDKDELTIEFSVGLKHKELISN